MAPPTDPCPVLSLNSSLSHHPYTCDADHGRSVRIYKNSDSLSNDSRAADQLSSHGWECMVYRRPRAGLPAGLRCQITAARGASCSRDVAKPRVSTPPGRVSRALATIPCAHVRNSASPTSPLQRSHSPRLPFLQARDDPAPALPRAYLAWHNPLGPVAGRLAMVRRATERR